MQDKLAHNSAVKQWPLMGSRIVGMPIRQSRIRPPHDGLQLPELSKESWEPIVDRLRVRRHFKSSSSTGNMVRKVRLTKLVLIGLDEPERVGLDRILVTGHFLLLETPVWQLDFVRE